MATPANVFIIDGTMVTHLFTRSDGMPDTVYSKLPAVLAMRLDHVGAAKALSRAFGSVYRNTPRTGDTLGLNVVGSFPVAEFDRTLLAYEGEWDYIINLTEDRVDTYHTPVDTPLRTNPLDYVNQLVEHVQGEVRTQMQGYIDYINRLGFTVASVR